MNENKIREGFSEFQAMVSDLEIEITNTVFDIIKQLRVPVQIELGGIEIPLLEATAVGEIDRRYVVGHSRIHVRLNLNER